MCQTKCRQGKGREGRPALTIQCLTRSLTTHRSRQREQTQVNRKRQGHRVERLGRDVRPGTGNSQGTTDSLGFVNTAGAGDSEGTDNSVRVNESVGEVWPTQPTWQQPAQDEEAPHLHRFITGVHS